MAGSWVSEEGDWGWPERQRFKLREAAKTTAGRGAILLVSGIVVAFAGGLVTGYVLQPGTGSSLSDSTIHAIQRIGLVLFLGGVAAIIVGLAISLFGPFKKKTKASREIVENNAVKPS